MTDSAETPSSIPTDGILPPADLPIRLDVFEGPLDLLLFLIRKNEIDIYDIPIEKVTLQYLEILRTQEKDNLELAGENRGPLALGIGINTARVVAGNIGSHRRLNYSVVGDGVNIAARLQQSAEPWSVWCSDRTARAAASAFEFGPTV